MKALIMNSGIGKRMGEFTADKNKCMAPLADGVTILSSQLDRLSKAGVMDVLITTGPFAQDLQRYALEKYPRMNFRFVHNPLYSETNYIYSIYLAGAFLKDDDILMLHGDLVFENSVLDDSLQSGYSTMVVDSTLPLPQKDFKAVITDGRITRVGVDVFENALAAQPLYKLKKNDWLPWLEEIARFCQAGNRGVYAENAFNQRSDEIAIYPLDVRGRLCGEVDSMQDLALMQQRYKEIV
ncbi:MAG: NTP transferase domain-containing protein [Christensenellales bacterium]|jgi:choline kinase